jgi:hypothetical protein
LRLITLGAGRGCSPHPGNEGWPSAGTSQNGGMLLLEREGGRRQLKLFAQKNVLSHVCLIPVLFSLATIDAITSQCFAEKTFSLSFSYKLSSTLLTGIPMNQISTHEMTL